MQLSSSGRVAGLAGAALLALGILAGCGGSRPGDGPDVPTALTESPGELTASPRTSDPVMPATETGTPTLPPGDPGTGTAAATSDEEHDHEEEPRRDIPDAALLDTQTLTAMLGQPWRATTAPADSCSTPRPASALVSRTSALSSPGNRLTQTVAVHPTRDAAERAVSVLGRRLASCGWTTEEAPLLGDAAAQVTRRAGATTERVVVVALEGVTVTLVAAGASIAAPPSLASVVDIAVGSSCAAAADGCH